MSGRPELLGVGSAQQQVLGALRPLPSEWVRIEEALGRTLVEDVRAQRTLPPWDNSAMDGYALRAADVVTAPTRLRVVETIHAGGHATRSLGPAEAMRIMTGAPVPSGADVVVMQEKTRRAPDGAWVEVLEVPQPGQSIRSAGEDARVGEVLLPAGTTLGIAEAALLWAQGRTEVSVPRRPRVALLTTGDELCRIDEAPDGRIVDTNTPALALAVARAGGVPTILGIAPDEEAAVHALFARAQGFDVVVSSAGVSVGDRDHVRGALDALGVKVHFWRCAIKPGKPILFGTTPGTAWFGLPGNPTSSLVTFELFVRPALRTLLGHRAALPVPVWGRLTQPLKKAPGLTHFVRVAAKVGVDDLEATPLTSQTSGALRSAAASHLLVFPADATELAPGARVALLPVSWAG